MLHEVNEIERLSNQRSLKMLQVFDATAIEKVSKYIWISVVNRFEFSCHHLLRVLRIPLSSHERKL